MLNRAREDTVFVLFKQTEKHNSGEVTSRNISDVVLMMSFFLFPSFADTLLNQFYTTNNSFGLSSMLLAVSLNGTKSKHKQPESSQKTTNGEKRLKL